MSLRLIQLSDLHLGRTFGSLGLPEEQRRAFLAANRSAVDVACRLADAHDAAAVLIAGDLFDRPDVDEELFAHVRTQLGDLGRPVLVSPGNHDAYGPMSVWNDAALARMGLPRWPENVHVFTTREFSTRLLRDGSLAVHGHRVVGYDTMASSPLRSVALTTDARWNVLLIHGALRASRFVERGTLPFTVEQLAEVGADYAAVGHHHRHQRIEHGGRLLGAYAGVPVPGEWTEHPHGGVLVVTLEDAGAVVACERVWSGGVVRCEVHADPPVEDVEQAAALLRREAAGQGWGAEDVVLVTLTGFSVGGLDAAEVEERLQGVFRHVVLRDDTLPARGAAACGRVTVEQQFGQRMDARIAAAGDADERGLLEAARRYGWLALRGRAVRPPAVVVGKPERGRDAD